MAANTRNSNVFSGKLFERAPYHAIGTYYSTGSATGLEERIMVGGVAVTDTRPVNTQNRSPLVPDDLVISGFEVYAGQQIVVEVNNTTGGALTHRARIELEEGEAY